MQKIMTCSVFVAYLLASSTFSGSFQQQSESPTENEPTSLLMEAKLSNSQQLLRGLVTEDFVCIEKAALKMKKIAEAAHWPSTVDEIYQHYSFEFRRQCEKLVSLAQNKDLQASHFTFLQLSTTCVDCHNYVRPRFKVERKPEGPIRLIPTEWDRKKHYERPSPDNATTTRKSATNRLKSK